jgi:hypothetical protein
MRGDGVSGICGHFLSGRRRDRCVRDRCVRVPTVAGRVELSMVLDPGGVGPVRVVRVVMKLAPKG